jgi:hypothetical protein
MRIVYFGKPKSGKSTRLMEESKKGVPGFDFDWLYATFHIHLEDYPTMEDSWAELTKLFFEKFYSEEFPYTVVYTPYRPFAEELVKREWRLRSL